MVDRSPEGKKVLVLYDFHYLAPRIRLQLDSMRRRNMEVILLRWVREDERYPAESDWTTIDIQVRGATGHAAIFSALPELYRALNRSAANLDFDLIQASSLTLLPIGLYLARKHQVPVVYDAYEFYNFNYARHFRLLSGYVQKAVEIAENTLVSYADGVLCTDSNNNLYLKRYKKANQNTMPLLNVPSVKDIDISNDHNRLEYLNKLNGDASYITFTGSFQEATGSVQILKALELIRKKDIPVKLLLIGYSFFQNGSLMAWEETQLKEYGTNLPFMPYTEMLPYLHLAKMGLVLYPKRPKLALYGPGNSRKLFTYMAAGLPVVGSQSSAITEVIKETGCGLRVDESSPEAIAEAVCYLLNHPREAEKMGARGREAILQKYNWEKEEPKFWQVYQHALQAR